MSSAAATIAATPSGRTSTASNVPGTTGTPAAFAVRRGDQLVAQCLDRVGARADEHETGVGHRPREGGSLRQEPVARMDGLGAGSERRLDDRVGTEITLRGRRRAESHRRVGGLHMKCIRVRIRIHRDRLDPQVATRPDDAHGDLTTVGDEDPQEGSSTVLAQRHLAPGRPRGRGHSGMLPCFFGGFVSRLSASISNALMSRGRVSDGRMTSSTYPRAAATYGLAKRSS